MLENTMHNVKALDRQLMDACAQFKPGWKK
jgi:hypothetical protein